MSGQKRHVIRKVPPPKLADFDEQLWPTNLLIAALAAFLAVLVIKNAEFDFQRTSFFANGYVQLGIIGLLMAGLAAAMAWLHARGVRRVQLCVLFSLIVHLGLLAYLERQQLAVIFSWHREPVLPALVDRPKVTIPDYTFGLERQRQPEPFEQPARVRVRPQMAQPDVPRLRELGPLAQEHLSPTLREPKLKPRFEAERPKEVSQPRVPRATPQRRRTAEERLPQLATRERVPQLKPKSESPQKLTAKASPVRPRPLELQVEPSRLDFVPSAVQPARPSETTARRPNLPAAARSERLAAAPKRLEELQAEMPRISAQGSPAPLKAVPRGIMRPRALPGWQELSSDAAALGKPRVEVYDRHRHPEPNAVSVRAPERKGTGLPSIKQEMVEPGVVARDASKTSRDEPSSAQRLLARVERSPITVRRPALELESLTSVAASVPSVGPEPSQPAIWESSPRVGVEAVRGLAAARRNIASIPDLSEGEITPTLQLGPNQEQGPMLRAGVGRAPDAAALVAVSTAVDSDVLRPLADATIAKVAAPQGLMAESRSGSSPGRFVGVLTTEGGFGRLAKGRTPASVPGIVGEVADTGGTVAAPAGGNKARLEAAAQGDQTSEQMAEVLAATLPAGDFSQQGQHVAGGMLQGEPPSIVPDTAGTGRAGQGISTGIATSGAIVGSGGRSIASLPGLETAALGIEQESWPVAPTGTGQAERLAAQVVASSPSAGTGLGGGLDVLSGTLGENSVQGAADLGMPGPFRAGTPSGTERQLAAVGTGQAVVAPARQFADLPSIEGLIETPNMAAGSAAESADKLSDSQLHAPLDLKAPIASSGPSGPLEPLGTGLRQPSTEGALVAGLPATSGADASQQGFGRLAAVGATGARRASPLKAIDAALLYEPSPFYSQRSREKRDLFVQQYGGSPETERAVELALAFLAKAQFADGRWRLDAWPGELSRATRKDLPVSVRSDTAATALALLAFLGAGYTHLDGKYRDVVASGLDWLIQKQQRDGSFFAQETDPHRGSQIYAHGIATIALCEAYGLTRDPRLRRSAENAIAFIIWAQDPQRGGWRYTKRPEDATWVRQSDTSVSGWQLMALKSAQMAGIPVPDAVWQKASHWLDIAQHDGGAQYCYSPFVPSSPHQPAGDQPNLAMTAEGLLMRLYLGWQPEHEPFRRGVVILSQNPPVIDARKPDARDAYYWYYATQVMFQAQGTHWQQWNQAMQKALLHTQVKEGPLAGSWDPNKPVADRWAHAGGRLYVTALHTLMLEVYYRHLPLYKVLLSSQEQ